MSTVSISDVCAVVADAAALDGADLQAIIDREEAELTARLGSREGPVVEVLAGGAASLWTQRRIASVTSVAQDVTAVASTAYVVWGKQGRIQRTQGGCWGAVCTVTYTPADAALWTQVVIELVRLAIEQTAMQSESVAGEYSYQAPEWERARQRQYRRLALVEL